MLKKEGLAAISCKGVHSPNMLEDMFLGAVEEVTGEKQEEHHRSRTDEELIEQAKKHGFSWAKVFKTESVYTAYSEEEFMEMAEGFMGRLKHLEDEAMEKVKTNVLERFRKTQGLIK